MMTQKMYNTGLLIMLAQVMKKQLTIAILTLLFSQSLLAEIYKHVDSEGRVTYSNIKTPGSVRLEIESAPSSSTKAAGGNHAPNKRIDTPSNFPRVDKNTQDQRDLKRKNILQNELEAEKLALEDAKKAYTEGEEKPEIYRNANGKIFRNVPKYEEKMKGLKENVDNHQKNIELLQKELDSLR